jgi:hypothetical protein
LPPGTTICLKSQSFGQVPRQQEVSEIRLRAF